MVIAPLIFPLQCQNTKTWESKKEHAGELVAPVNDFSHPRALLGYTTGINAVSHKETHLQTSVLSHGWLCLPELSAHSRTVNHHGSAAVLCLQESLSEYDVPIFNQRQKFCTAGFTQNAAILLGKERLHGVTLSPSNRNNCPGEPQSEPEGEWQWLPIFRSQLLWVGLLCIYSYLFFCGNCIWGQSVGTTG